MVAVHAEGWQKHCSIRETTAKAYYLGGICSKHIAIAKSSSAPRIAVIRTWPLPQTTTIGHHYTSFNVPCPRFSFVTIARICAWPHQHNRPSLITRARGMQVQFTHVACSSTHDRRAVQEGPERPWILAVWVVLRGSRVCWSTLTQP